MAQIMHTNQTPLYQQDEDEDDLLADDLDDLIAEVNDNPSLKEFSSKKSKRETNSYGYSYQNSCNSCSPLQIWEDTATEGDAEQGEENLLDFGSFTDIHNHNNLNTSSFEEQIINKHMEYPQTQQSSSSSSKAILVVQAICSEQQSYLKRGQSPKKSDDKENVNPNWKQQKIHLTEKRQFNQSSLKERTGLKERKIQKVHDKNIMKVEKICENIKEEHSKKWMNPEKEGLNARMASSHGKQKQFGVERAYSGRVVGNNQNFQYNCSSDNVQSRNGRMMHGGNFYAQNSNNSVFATSSVVQHSNEQQMQQTSSSNFMDGCVKRMSKLELEKMRFQAQLEEERKKQITCLSDQVLKFDF